MAGNTDVCKSLRAIARVLKRGFSDTNDRLEAIEAAIKDGAIDPSDAAADTTGIEESLQNLISIIATGPQRRQKAKKRAKAAKDKKAWEAADQRQRQEERADLQRAYEKAQRGID
jgi:hypothetical protein